MMLLQDVSHSFGDDVKQLQTKLPIVIDELIKQYPQSQFSLSTFSDYPMPDVGWSKYSPRDFCFRQNVPFTTTSADVVKAVQRLKIVSGRDIPEGQLTALHHAAAGGYFKNRKFKNDVKDVKLVVLSTDAKYHVAGDLAKEAAKHKELSTDVKFRELFPRRFFENHRSFNVRPNDGDGRLSCTGDSLEDYPSVCCTLC